MKITVAIACYNLENRIANCLKSVIAQDYQDIEILIIDDHSSDNSVNVVKEIINEHPEREFRLLINEQGGGICKVRNISIDEAHGDALFFMDGDDTIEPGTLSLFCKRMEDTGVEVVCGSFRKIDDNGDVLITKQFPEDTVYGDFAFASYIEKKTHGFFWLGLWNILYRLDFLRSHNIYCATHYNKHEGGLFIFNVVLNANSVSYIHEVTYNWFNNQSSITNSNKKNKNFLVDFRVIIESLIEAKNNFEYSHNNLSLPKGANFLLNFEILTQGYLRVGLLSSKISNSEKKQFLKWLKDLYHVNHMNLSNIVGSYNRISYLILISPFPYALFRFYFKHLKTFVKIVNRLSKV